MLRLSPSFRRFALFLPLLGAAALVFLLLTSQSGPPQPIRVFGIDHGELEEGFGILVYPPDGKAALSADAAMAAAQETDGDGNIAGAELVHIKLVYEGFDGLAWAVKWDVDGKGAIQPVGSVEAEQEPPWLYVFDVTFIDAQTGAFLAGAELTSPAADFEKARDHVITR